MSFGALSLGGFLIGAVLLAAVLYLLQRLRVRHKRVVVVTALFWKQAVEESRARVLMHRFRHFFAYLFILGILLLLWGAWARPKLAEENSKHTIFAIEASARAAFGDSYQQSLLLLKEAVQALPIDRRSVYWCGQDELKLLGAGEQSVLLEERLKGLSPASSPSTIQFLLNHHLAAFEQEGELEIVLVGRSDFPEDSQKLLPDGVSLSFLAPPQEKNVVNHGIVQLGLSPALSGAYEKVDVLVKVHSGGQERLLPSFRLGAKDWQPSLEHSQAQSLDSYIIRDVPAQGQKLSARLNVEDALSLDNYASVRLPVLNRIRVQLSESLMKGSIGQVLALDPAIEMVNNSERVDVVIGESGEPDLNSQIPALIFSQSIEDAAIVISNEFDGGGVKAVDAQQKINELFGELGLAEIDAQFIAGELEQRIEMQIRQADKRQIELWEVLLEPKFNFVNSPAFALFMSQSMRYLAKHQAITPEVAAKKAVELADAPFRTAQGQQLHSLSSAFVPPMAGSYEGQKLGRVDVSLLDEASTLAYQEIAKPLTPWEIAKTPAPVNLAFWLIGFALLALLVEWALYRTDRMP